MASSALFRRLATAAALAGALALAVPVDARAERLAAPEPPAGSLAAQAGDAPSGSLAARAGDPPTGGAAPGGPSSRRDRSRRGSPSKRRRSRGRRSRNVGRPVLGQFSVSPGRAFLYGRSTTVRFRVSDRSRRVRMRLEVVIPGRRTVRRINLGARRTGVAQSFRLAGRAGGPLPQGGLELRLYGRDPGGKRLRPSKKASARRRLSFFWHHFPLAGNFRYGDPGSRFGAGRPGHVHQGQDIAAPEGTPVLAPRGGRVRSVAYQAGGAGHYVVLAGASEKRDYVFMHLRSGSVRVRPGQYVATGARLGDVGTTGASSGPHLHFEIWSGRWLAGGRPVDPLPHLLRWDRWS